MTAVPLVRNAGSPSQDGTPDIWSCVIALLFSGFARYSSCDVFRRSEGTIEKSVHASTME